MTLQKVIYCEWLAFGSPIKREMLLKDALKRFKIKIKALSGYLFKDSCFIGIKKLNGDWIIKNDEV